MGYYSNLYGKMTIDPPLEWKHFRGSAFNPEAPNYDKWHSPVAYEVEEDIQDTDTGTSIRREAVAIIPAWDEQAKMYEIEEQLRTLLAEVKAAGSVVYGALVRVGEGQGDIERFRIENRELVIEKAQVTWPDGSPVEESGY